MAKHIGPMIGDSLQLSLGYAERLLKEVTPEIFARFAFPGGIKVESNHPAFVYGHLSLYPSRIIEQLGGDPSPIAAPASFTSVFSKDAVCLDDPAGEIYPAMEQVVEIFFQGYRAVLPVLRETDDSVFLRPNPMGGRMAELFATLGSMHGFYVGGHMMMHLGQISAWRRMQGLGPA